MPEIGQTISHYRIIEKLGQGGMGEVFLAHDTSLDRKVALKFLPDIFSGDPERLARFEREAKLLASLNHPNIAAIHGFEQAEGKRFLAMELVEGETLAERIAKGALPVEEALEVCRQIAEGLEAAHEKGVIHRDLKPANVKITPEGRAKILDFGLAKAFQGEMPAADASKSPTLTNQMTRAGVILGTAAYMSPEQARGGEVDKRTDIWAFGVILFELLTGKACFERETVTDVLAAVMRDDPDWAKLPTGTPLRLRELLERCLVRDRRQRLRDIGDARLELEKMLESDNTWHGARAVASTVSIARMRRLRWAVAALLLVVAAATGALLHWLLAPGVPLMFQFTRKTFQREAIFSARFLPDGQTIVFSAARSGNTPALYEIRAGVLEARPFGPQGTHLLSVSPTGELAVLTNASYLGGNDFVGQLARMSLEGAPTPLKENVRDAAWSPKGTNMAIVYDQGSSDRLEYPIGTVLCQSDGYMSDLRISPDGSRVAFMDHRIRYDNRGWVKTVDTAGNVTTYTDEFWGLEGLGWSPDGSSLVFGAAGSQAGGGAHAGETSYQLFSVPVSAPKRLSRALSSACDVYFCDLASDGRYLIMRDDWRVGIAARGLHQPAERDLSWLTGSGGVSLSADGRRALFYESTVGEQYRVAWREVDGSPIRDLGEGISQGFSPDGRWALAISVSLPQHLVLYSMGAGSTVHLGRGSIETIQAACWHPDSKRVIIIGNEPSKPRRVYQQDIAGGMPKPLLPEGIVPLRPSFPSPWSAVDPDGRRIAAIDPGGSWGLYQLDGGPARTLAGLTPADLVLGWSSDGRWLYVRSGQEVPVRIEVVEVETGRRSPFMEIRPSDLAGLVLIDPSSLADSRQHYAYTYQRRLSTLFVVSGGK